MKPYSQDQLQERIQYIENKIEDAQKKFSRVGKDRLLSNKYTSREHYNCLMETQKQIYKLNNRKKNIEQILQREDILTV